MNQHDMGEEARGPVESLWKINLRRDREESNGLNTTKTGRMRVPQIARQPRLLLSFRRTLTEVEPKLFELLRKLFEGEAPWPLYLYGPSGTGKTAAALCACDIARTATYIDCESLADKVASGEDPWRRVREKHLACLDEIGARLKPGDLHYQAVKRFADERELHAGRVAIYVANVNPDQLIEMYDDRIGTRLLSGKVYRLTGENRRQGR